MPTGSWETLSKSYDDLLLQVQAAAENLTGERKQVAAKLEKEVCRELAYFGYAGYSLCSGLWQR